MLILGSVIPWDYNIILEFNTNPKVYNINIGFNIEPLDL